MEHSVVFRLHSDQWHNGSSHFWCTAKVQTSVANRICGFFGQQKKNARITMHCCSLSCWLANAFPNCITFLVPPTESGRQTKPSQKNTSQGWTTNNLNSRSSRPATGCVFSRPLPTYCPFIGCLVSSLTNVHAGDRDGRHHVGEADPEGGRPA